MKKNKKRQGKKDRIQYDNNTGQRAMQRKKSIFSYLNPKNLTSEIYRYGHDFSIGQFIKIMILVYLAFLALAWLYKLHIVPIMIIAVVLAIIVPNIKLQMYKQMNYVKMFDDVNNYMEQMMYSFKRRGKILSSFQDTISIFPEGMMHDDIQEAINCIQYSSTEENIFIEAFKFIERDYGCKRLYTLHDFLVNVENRGGKSTDSLDILLEDRKLWVERIYGFQKDKKSAKVKTTISIILAMVIGFTSVKILPKDLAVYDYAASQIVTTIVFIINIMIYFFANKMVSGALLDDALTESQLKQMKKDYEKVYIKGPKYKQKKNRTVAGLFFLIAVLMLGYNASSIGYILPIEKFISAITGNSKNLAMVILAVISIFLGFLMFTQSKRNYKFAKKRTRNEVEKAFPEWLLNMALLLQTNNVHVSISESISDAPPIMREELRLLEDRIAKDPNSIQPYLRFFKILDIPDMVSAMKILYAMAEFGTKDVTDQINTLVQRNATLTDRAERLKADDKLAFVSLFILAPMLSGVLKLVVDMGLIVISLLNYVNLDSVGM